MQQERSIFSLVNENDCLSPREDDIALWESFLADDAASFGCLFKKYYPHLFQYGMKVCKEKLLLEDTIQELFIDLWRKRNPVPTISVKAYLIKALKYKLLKEFGKENHHSIEDYEQDHLFEIPHETFLIARQEDKEKSERIIKALQQLSNRQKEIIYLKFYQGLDYEDVSTIMNINYQATRNLLYQAIKSLKKILFNTSLLLQ